MTAVPRTPVAPTEGRRSVVLYDRECGFCRWSLGVLLLWDRARRLRPVALQDEEALRLLAGESEAERMGALHVVDDHGRVHRGGAALVQLGRLLPGARPLARAGEALPGATERAYRLVAANRGLLGQLVTANARRRAERLIAERDRGGPAAPDGPPGPRTT